MTQDEQDEMNFMSALTKLGWVLLLSGCLLGILFWSTSYVLTQAKIHYEAIHSTTITPHH